MSSHRARLRAPGAVIDADAIIVTPGSLVTATRPDPGPSESGGLDLASLLEQARAEGYEAGVHAVASEQEVRRTAVVEAAARRLVEAAGEALADRAAIVNDAVTDAIDLALEIVRTILGHELQLAENPTREALELALRLAPDGDNFIVTVAPGSALDLNQLLALTHGAPISIREDPTIRRGDCVVEVAACRIDHQVEHALARVRSELERLVPRSAAEDVA